MRTGDHVLHKPSGETWVVAGVWPDDDRMSWLGWPEGYAKLSDCELVKAATDAEHRGHLQAMAEMEGNDHRKRYAQRVLGLICSRCSRPLDNVSPGFSVVTGSALVCAPCLHPGEEVARARGLL